MNAFSSRFLASLVGASLGCLLCLAPIDAQAQDNVAKADSLSGVVMDGTPSPSEELVAADAANSKFDRTDALIASLTIFGLAVFVGFEIITKVPPTLHTPLMSGSNAISGVTLIGAALVAGGSGKGFAGILGMLAVALAAVNVVGGFMVTDRMLSMFRKKK